MNANTPKIRLRRLLDGDIKNDVVMSRNVDAFDAMSLLVLESVTTTTQPSTTVVGTSYFVPSGSTGPQWSKISNTIFLNTQSGALFVPIFEGCRAYVKDQDRFLVYFNSAWREFGVLRKAIITLDAPIVSNFVRKPLFKTQSACTILNVRIQVRSPFSSQAIAASVGYSTTQFGTETTIADSWNTQRIGTLVNASVPANRYVWVSLDSSTVGGTFCIVLTYVEDI